MNTKGTMNAKNDLADNIQFTDIFVLEEIQHLQDLFSNATGVASIITKPDGTPITKPSNFCRLCNSIIRKTEKGLSNCYKSDAALGLQNSTGPTVQPCLSGGLWDAGASITVEGKHIANWLIGQVRNEDLNEEKMLHYADEIGVDRDVFIKALKEVPIMSIEQFESVSKMLFAFAKELSEKAVNIVRLKQRCEEKELQLSSQKHQILFENSPDAYLIIENGVFIDCNKATEELLLGSKEMIIGQTPSIISPEFQPDGQKSSEAEKEKIEYAIRTGKNKFEWMHRRFDGTDFWVDVSLSLMVINESSMLFVTWREITDRKLSEARLNESERKYRNLFENAQEGVFQTNLDGTYRSVNPALARMYGFNSPEELINSRTDISNDAYCDPKERENFIRMMEKNGYVRGYEYEVKRKDGKKIWFYEDAKAIKDENGKILYFEGFVVDITERKQTEEILKKSSDDFKELFDKAPIGYHEIDTEGRICRINETELKMLGYSHDELIGQPFWQLSSNAENSRQAIFAKLTGTLPPSQPYEREFVRKNGAKVPVLVTDTIQKSNTGKITGIRSTVLDITERKHTEEELLRNEARLRSLVNLIQSPVESTQQFLDNALQEAISLTDSKIGYIYFYSEEKKEFTLNTWSNEVMKECRVLEPQTIYILEKTGIWGEAVRQRKPIMLNNFQSPHALKKGYPEGHVSLKKFLTVPVFIEDKIVAVVGVANKDNDYNETDILQLSLLMDNVWKVVSRKEAEKALSESEERYRTVVSNTPVVTFVTDDKGVFTLSEGMGLAKLGLQPGQMVGMSLFDVYRDYPSIIKAMNDALTGNFVRNEEDVQGIVFDVCFSPIFDRNGKVVKVIGVSNDVTERTLAEKALKASEEKLSALFGAMTEMVALHELVFDEQGEAINYRIIDCNSMYTEITGIKKENAVGRLATDVYQSETPPYLKEFSQVGITGEPFEYTTYYPPMDKHFMISVVSPKKNQFATITTDITAIHEIQEVISAKNKELENYLYVASHDLRSPLVNILGFSQRLQKQAETIKNILAESNIEPEVLSNIEKITTEGIPKTMNFIFSNVTKMDTLINGLLQISRTGRIKMTIKKVDINLLFKTIINTLNFQLCEISANVNVDNLPDCYGDENQLNQLFTNIIVNAIKYRDKQRPLLISITATNQYHKVIYSIKDNGIGIAKRHLEKIWDVFYRVDATSPEAGEGIGLSLVKRIVDKHKGKIWTESEEGKGSTFFVELLKSEFTE